jgi:hypothetical protein
MPSKSDTMIYSDYTELYYTIADCEKLYREYVHWCKQHCCDPEVDHAEDIDTSNIGHVVYHAIAYRYEKEQHRRRIKHADKNK